MKTLITLKKSFVKFLSVAVILIAASFLTCSNPSSSEFGLTPDGREYNDDGGNDGGGGGGGGGTPVYGSCTVGSSCTNNVLQSACTGTFRANQTCPAVYGSCTMSNGTCTNNVLSTNCSGTFRANQSCPLPATQIRITLTSWSTTHTDFPSDRNLDPRISFTVGGISTGVLLEQSNIGSQSWNGSRPSGWISVGTSGSLTIRATVVEMDPLANDDISPSGSYTIPLPQPVGATGSASIGTARSDESRVGFSWEFR